MKKGFQKPTVDELREYAAAIGFQEFDAVRFFDHYEMTGWCVGKNRTPMACWRAAVRTWQRNLAEWRGQKAGAKPEPAVAEYAAQARALVAAGGYEIGRFWRKVQDALGPDGVAQVKAAMRT